MMTRSDFGTLLFAFALVIASALIGRSCVPVPTKAHAESGSITLHKGCYRHWTIKIDSSEYEAYKNARLIEYEDMLCDAGIKKSDDLKLLAAQLIVEDGSLSESVIGDYGCSLGIPQYNACAHDGISAKKFLHDHQEWSDYRYQLKWIAEAMMNKYGAFPSIRLALIAYNSPRSAAMNIDTGYYEAVMQKSAILTR